MSEKDYSYRLNMFGLPIIRTVDDFSFNTHISKSTIYKLSKFSSNQYITFTIPKKNGGLRQISAPSRKLKALQAWILVSILDKIQVSESCKGFEKKSTTKNNAEPHIGSNALLCIDIKNFFPSISSKYIYHIFRSIGYNSQISSIFTNICTYDGVLPQGSPTSPKLANLVAWNLDLRIQGYVGKRGIIYTRYADDITFSSMSPNKLPEIYFFVNEIIESENFKINKNKTRYLGTKKCKKVTGLIINEKSVGVGTKFYRMVRSLINSLTLKENSDNLVLYNKARGYIAYLKSIDKVRHNKIKKYIKSRNDKYPTQFLGQLIENLEKSNIDTPPKKEKKQKTISPL
jgi:RNA-directed DNA polymerase